MITYSADLTCAYCDGLLFRRDNKTGYYLAAKPTFQGKRERLHRYVYRVYVGDIPAGYHIHHIDENKNNNEPDNLECITQHDHESYHRAKYAKNHKKEVLDNLVNAAMPKAQEWHGSPEGIEWHRKHGKTAYKQIAQTIERKCDYCGKDYAVIMISKNQSRFCSNKCKAAYRRDSGVDNEERCCQECGKTFIVNKYSAVKYCSAECKKKNNGKKYSLNGQTHTLSEWSKISGISEKVLRDRLFKLKWDFEKTIKTPVRSRKAA